jgi:hypothetical protein
LGRSRAHGRPSRFFHRHQVNAARVPRAPDGGGAGGGGRRPTPARQTMCTCGAAR